MQTMSPNAAAPPPLPPKTRKKAHVVSIRVSSAQSAPQITASDGGCVRISVNRLPVGYYLYNGFKCADHIEDAIVSPSPPPPPPKSTSVRVTVNGEDKKRIIKPETKYSPHEVLKTNGTIESVTNNDAEPEKNDAALLRCAEPENGMKRCGAEPEKKNGTVTLPEKRCGSEPEKNGTVALPEKKCDAEPEKKNGAVALLEKKCGAELEKKNGTVALLEKKCGEELEKKNGTVAVSEKKCGAQPERKNGIVQELEKRSCVVTGLEKKNGIVIEPAKKNEVKSEPETKSEAEPLGEVCQLVNGTLGMKCQSPVSEPESLKVGSSAEVSPNSTMNLVKRRVPKVVEERTYEERKAPVVAAVTYDADHYYDFHLHEAQPAPGEQVNGDEDYFAGCRSFGLQESSIKSSKGTIRGVKNRVRAGVATFLQMQSTQPFAAKEAGQVVVYTTTMGIVRATAQRCARVRQILRTLLVRFDERDLFMARDAQAELQSRLGTTGLPQLPQVFVEGRLLGDAETVERLNESGELRKMLKTYKSPDAATPCEVCGGYRLLPCAVCNGSKKSVHRNHFTAELVALRCMNCDEVGLVRCYAC